MVYLGLGLQRIPAASSRAAKLKKHLKGGDACECNRTIKEIKTEEEEDV
jgi:phosphoenolpyruvate-protein kinase (PTS system EI component)